MYDIDGMISIRYCQCTLQQLFLKKTKDNTMQQCDINFLIYRILWMHGKLQSQMPSKTICFGSENSVCNISSVLVIDRQGGDND